MKTKGTDKILKTGTLDQINDLFDLDEQDDGFEIDPDSFELTEDSVSKGKDGYVIFFLFVPNKKNKINNSSN